MDAWAIIGVVITAVGIIIGAVQYMISNAFKKGEENQRIHDTHEQVKAYGSKTVECEKRFTQLEERKIDSKSLDDIRMDITLIKGSLEGVLSSGFAGALIQSHSPVSLTEAGKALAENMGLEARISNSWDKIYAFLNDNLLSKNAYDIQQFCIETASVFPEKFLSDEDVLFLKNYAYQEGKSLVYYGGMIGVMIRDEYFKHKGIDVGEIDKHDPKKK